MDQKTQEAFENIGNAAKNAAKNAMAKAGEGLKAFGSNVAGASKEFINDTKLTAEKNHKQKELDAAYKELGECVYQQGGLTGKASEISEKIRGIYTELQNIEMELNKK